jgi:small subunit ribosomal protein S2
MPVVTRRELLEAGVHFGHQTRRWNPKMGRYLYGERSGIYIIDLEKTLTGLEEAYTFAADLGRRGGVVLFVGTKKQAQEVIVEHADRVGMPYVTTRWLGGMLTNFQTVSRRLIRLRELREMERTGAFDYLPKKEAIRLRHEREKLERNLGGMQALDRLPDAVFVIDTKKEHIAVNEARKLGLPVIAIVDTNCDPDEVDYVIPGNDDAIRSVQLVTRLIADALVQGRQVGREAMVTRATGPEIEPEPQAAEPAPAAPEPAPAEPAPAPPRTEAPPPATTVSEQASTEGAESASAAATATTAPTADAPSDATPEPASDAPGDATTADADTETTTTEGS